MGFSRCAKRKKVLFFLVLERLEQEGGGRERGREREGGGWRALSLHEHGS